MHSNIRSNSYVLLRLPSDTLKVVQVIPDTNISIGKYGSFSANLLVGRSYYLTFEILEQQKDGSGSELRIVPASELHAGALQEEDDALRDNDEEGLVAADGEEFDIIGENGDMVMRNNRFTVDDTSRQLLSMKEIEELKKVSTGSGKEIVAKIMASHMALDEKTAFSLAKYTLRKSKKYMRRFTVLPLNVSSLTQWMAMQKDATRIMDLREESLGLIASWSNVHHFSPSMPVTTTEASTEPGRGRWLVVDETGGLVVATVAERIGILYPASDQAQEETAEDLLHANHHAVAAEENAAEDAMIAEASLQDQVNSEGVDIPDKTHTASSKRRTSRQIRAMSAKNNTITLIHSNKQPNIGLLKYFDFDPNNPPSSHPLYTHLKTISWLQLLHPEEDVDYIEPPLESNTVLQTWKSNKRSAYFRKRRRWERVKSVVDESRAGGFDGLVVASFMEPAAILRHTIPLLRGGAQVVVYSPTVEPLSELMDCYSKQRKLAYIRQTEQLNGVLNEEDFPVDPNLLIGSTLQTARARHWQVLPGRTHPLMTGRGGPDGYIFTATRVLPSETKVEARGNYNKKRKVERNGAAKPVPLSISEDQEL